MIMLSVHGCKIESSSGNDNGSNICSCCYHPSPDIMSCNICTNQTWTKKEGESCNEARKRKYGTTNGCCSNSKNNKREKRTRSLPLNCTNECTNNSAYCLKVVLNNTELSLPTQKLLSAINNIEDGILKKTEIMDYYDVPIDPCDRSNLIKVGTLLSNNGDKCYFGKKFIFIDEIDIGITLPLK